MSSTALLAVTNKAINQLINSLWNNSRSLWERRVIVSFSLMQGVHHKHALKRERERVLTERFVNGQSKNVRSHIVQSHNEE